MAECKTEKSKHLQRKKFGTACEQIEYNVSTRRIVALNEWKNDIEMINIIVGLLSVEEESVNFIWKNGVSQLQANCRQVENSEQTGK